MTKEEHYKCYREYINKYAKLGYLCTTFLDEDTRWLMTAHLIQSMPASRAIDIIVSESENDSFLTEVSYTFFVVASALKMELHDMHEIKNAEKPEYVRFNELLQKAKRSIFLCFIDLIEKDLAEQYKKMQSLYWENNRPDLAFGIANELLREIGLRCGFIDEKFAEKSENKIKH